MQCPDCQLTHICKNGKKRGKQNHTCKNCGRQFIDEDELHPSYSPEIQQICLRMYANGSGFRAIERVRDVHHSTVIHWVKQVGERLPDAYWPETMPEVGEADELEIFIGKKIWIWTAVDHFHPGILGRGVGDHSAETFCHRFCHSFATHLLH